MKQPSRLMPKARYKAIGVRGWAVLLALGLALAWAVAERPWLLAPVALLIAASWWLTHRERRHLEALAAQRHGESICTFARSFERNEVDTWVVRAVFEELQSQLGWRGAPFPLRAEDRLKADLHLDDDDLDLDVVGAVAERTGRSLEGLEANPLHGKVETVRDLVLFFAGQPKRELEEKTRA